MDAPTDTIAARVRRGVAVSLLALAAAVLMTWPLAAGFGSLGRVNSGDGRFSIWNVAWVAHALTTAPSKVYDANIFYPHRGTLAYSETNLAAGAIAVPFWVLSGGNPYAAHNGVVLFSFGATLITTWLLVRRLSGDGAAAAVSAVLFAFCPFLFAHTAHIQLLMCAGIPLSMLLLHRLVDGPSPTRGLGLGCALGVQGLSCAYYGVFAGLMVGYGVFFYACARRLWRTPRYWIAVAIAAGSSIAVVLPFFLPYVQLQQGEGFRRSLDDARMYSAILRSYGASGATAHRWILPLIGTWNNEVLFPGLLAIVLGVTGLVVIAKPADPAAPAGGNRPNVRRETGFLYASLGLLAFWASFGPRAGLYTLLFHTVPVFSFLRAPGRMGLVVALAIAVLAGFAVEWLRMRLERRRRALTVALVLAALIDLNALPLDWRTVEPVSPGYLMLANMPRGPVAEFPFYDRRIDFHVHTRYLLMSVYHWQPLLNGYSDYIPPDFRTLATTLASFPSRDAFAALRDRRTRYVVLHKDRDGYGRSMPEIERRLDPFRMHLRPIASDERMAVYEIVSWP